MEHIGIDVAKVNSQICILTESGAVIERRFRTSPANFAELLAERPRARVLIEACGESEWIARCIEALGHEVVVADPGYRIMYGARGNGIKTDRRDAKALAQALRVGAYRIAHRLSEPQRRVRRRIVVREQLVRARTRMVILIQALLRQDGIHVPSGMPENLERRLEGLEIPGHLMSAIAPLLASLQVLNRQIDYADDVIEQYAKEDELARNLRSVPGVGPLTATIFVNTIDDPSRFANAHKVGAFLGLVPREHSSGEHQRRGSITKAGNVRARVLLLQAAIRMMRIKDPRAAVLWSWAENVAERRGRKVARIALARRLAGVLFALMRDNSTFKGATAVMAA